MTTTDERLKVLKMIQEGKLSAEDGIALLEVMAGQKRAAPPPQAAAASSGRWFRVRVTDTRTGRTRVNLRMPVSMVSAGMKLGARFAPQVQGLEAGALMDMLNAGMVGQIVDVLNEEESEHVEVFIE